VALTADRSRVVVDRGAHLGARTRATPVRLRIVAVGLVILSLLMGLFAALAASDRHAATTTAWQSAEPLLVESQAIDTSLSQADTTAAGSFLLGRISPDVHARYLTDVAHASTSLAAAALGAGSSPVVTASIGTLAVYLPKYTGLVETATFNERQGYYPLAAAYLAEANNLMRKALLPAATQLYQAEGQALATDQSDAVGLALVVVAVLFLVALLVSLIVVQRWLRARFRRTVSVPLAVATALVIVLGIWFLVAMAAQSSGVATASANGSRPVALYTKARIVALQLRGDDELTLLTRDSVTSYQDDYATAVQGLRRGFAAARRGAGSAERTQLGLITTAFDAYDQTHNDIRHDDMSGDLTKAVDVASGIHSTDLPAVSSRLDAVLTNGIVSSKQTFREAASAAAGDLIGLIWASAIVSMLAALLVQLAIRPRLAEYR
jgi:hypothetical protein